MKSALIFFFCLSLVSGAIRNALEFFSDLGHDASRITWGHAINSREKLESAIKDDNVMMLEADVLLGHLGFDVTKATLPVMSHPPELSSNISLENWIKDVIDANEKNIKKGAKLDFKEINVVPQSMHLLIGYIEKINFPLWLNADIMRGPGGGNRVPVEKNSFIKLCRDYFPTATLSVGWTTGYNPETKQSYTKEMVNDMVEFLKHQELNQNITFPIRAAFVKDSLDNLMILVDNVRNSSITVWSSESDKVDPSGLVDLIKRAGKDRVYVDLPPIQLAEFKINLSANSSSNISIHLSHLLMILIVIALTNY